MSMYNEGEPATSIRTTTELVRRTIYTSMVEDDTPIVDCDKSSNLYLGVNTGYVGAFEFVDAQNRLWSVEVRPSERLR